MLTIPAIEQHAAKDYAYISFIVPMSEMKRPAQEGFPTLFDWLRRHNVTPTGAPFYNYRRIDMASTLEVEAGVPVDHTTPGDGAVKFGQLPAGRYVSTHHTGPYEHLYDATAMLIGWAKERGVAWDMTQASDGEHFACRLEIYETDPEQETDPAKWVTRLLFKTAE